jgi:hypothetical protein
MTYFDMRQQGGLHNPGQWGWGNAQNAQMYGQHSRGQGFGAQGLGVDGLMSGNGLGIGQAAFGPQQFGAYGNAYGGNPWGQPNIGAFGQGMWGAQPNLAMQAGWGQ